MDTPFAVLENILREETGKETVLYGFRGQRSATPVIYAFTEGARNLGVHVRMSFEDDLLGRIYNLFAPGTFPAFFKKVESGDGEKVWSVEHDAGAYCQYGLWQIEQMPVYPFSKEEQTTILTSTPQTAYLHCWDGEELSANPGETTIRMPCLQLFSADAAELRCYLAEFEAKIPARYILSIPGSEYELNTNEKSEGEIYSNINTGLGGGSADKVISGFERQAQEAAAKIALLKPYHESMKEFVLAAQRTYVQVRKEYYDRERASA